MSIIKIVRCCKYPLFVRGITIGSCEKCNRLYSVDQCDMTEVFTFEVKFRNKYLFFMEIE